MFLSAFVFTCNPYPLGVPPCQHSSVVIICSVPELWEIRGSHWVLPVLVERHTDVAYVTLAPIPMLGIQRAVLINAIEQVSVNRVEDSYVVPFGPWCDIAEKSKQDNAEQVVEWNRVAGERVYLPGNPDLDTFAADWLVHSGYSFSKASAVTLHLSIFSHMMHWLVNLHRPVDVLFAVIHPLQMRRNWKEIIYGQAWQSGKDVSKTMPLPADLGQSYMVQYRSGVCQWHLELSESNAYRQAMETAENKRRRRLNGNYFKSVCRTIMSQAARAIRIYKEFTQHEGASIVQLPEFNVVDGGYFGAIKKEPVARRCLPWRTFVLPADVAQAQQPCPPFDERESDADLPTLSSVPRADATVRSPGPDLGESADGQI